VIRRVIIAAGLLLAGPVAAQTNAPAPASAADWSKRVEATAEGGIRMGNPAAPVKLVEFLSLTCGHCGTFAADAVPVLVRDHVRSGRLSFELRPFPLDVVAATAAQLTRCAAPAKGFALSHDILVEQEAWIARLDTLTDQQIDAIEAAPPAQQRRQIISAVGLDAVAARHGMSTQQVDACMADQAAADRIMAIQRAGEQIGVQGTPSFTINGQLAQDVHNWAALEPLLRR